jgi:hypothetical protein
MVTLRTMGIAASAAAALTLSEAAHSQCSIQELHPAPLASGDGLGAALDADGLLFDLALLGAPGADAPGAPDAGAAWVMGRPTPWSLWETRAQLLAPAPAAGDELGRAVAVEGAVAVAGAPGHAAPLPGTGVVHVFGFDGGTWAHDQTLFAAQPEAGARLGCAVVLDGTRLAVGARGADTAAPDAGAVEVFAFDGAAWVHHQTLAASDAATGAEFGAALSLVGDQLVVGAPGTGAGAGAVYVFLEIGGVWVEESKLVDPSAAAGDALGAAVAARAGVLAAGAPGDDGGGPDAGAVQVFERGVVWGHTDEVTLFNAAAGDRFGAAVSLDDFFVGGGAPGSSGGSGAVVLFQGFPGSWHFWGSFAPCNGGAGDGLGAAFVSDTGGVLVGARGHDDPVLDAGLVYQTGIGDCALTRFCFGDGSGTPCPCGNGGTCDAGCAGSAGEGASLWTYGTGSVAADDQLFLAHDLLPGQPALLFVGNQLLANGDGVPFGDGLRCVGQQVVRLGVRFPDGIGDAVWGPGLGATGGWGAGDVRYFQSWFRDPGGAPCGSGFNLSDAVLIFFGP